MELSDRIIAAAVAAATAAVDTAKEVVTTTDEYTGLVDHTAASTDLAHASDGTHQLFMRAAVMLSLILVSMHINGFLHHKKFNYLGESAVTIILGLFVATVWRFIDSDDQAKTIQLSSNLFYMVLLPPIIFEAGFALQKVAFFRNLRSIVSLAFVGALFSTFLTSTLMYFFSKLTKTSWSFVESLVFGSLISSTDPVTVLSLLPSNVDKNLYMLIFGESALNDAVSIILYRFFTDLADPKMRLSVSSFFILVLQSAGVFIGSTIVGFAVAVLFALLTKHIRFMHDQPIYETTMLFIFAYLSYLVADILSLTGIISIFFCGIGMSYYAMNNVTKKAKSSIKVLLRFLSSTCEGFVFLYLGLGLLSFGGQTVYDPVLIVFSFLTIMISRCHVFLLVGLGWIVPGGSKVPWNHATLIWWSGLRGAVAFALSVSFSEHPVFDADIKGQIFGTTVMTVVLTVMIFGGFTPAMLKGLKIITPKDTAAANSHELLEKKLAGHDQAIDPEKQGVLTEEEINAHGIKGLSRIQTTKNHGQTYQELDDHGDVEEQEIQPNTADLRKPELGWLHMLHMRIRPYLTVDNNANPVSHEGILPQSQLNNSAASPSHSLGSGSTPSAKVSPSAANDSSGKHIDMEYFLDDSDTVHLMSPAKQDTTIQLQELDK